MAKIYFILLLTLIVSGCASHSKVAKIEPSEWTELKCSGFLTWHDCRQEARAICPRGFYTADYYENYRIQRREVSVACKA
jgi:hypothetical protein